MPAKILYGHKAADRLLQSLANKIKKLNPKLVIVQIGENASSASYIRQKINVCRRIGLRYEHLHLPAAVTKKKLSEIIHQLNGHEDISGFIIQLPLPGHLQKHLPEIIREIDPKKDVDGFGAYNLGKMFLSTAFEHLPPATPAGVIALLDYYKIPVKGRHAVVVGHSNLVGKPLSTMLLNRNATVTTCHIFTRGLAHFTKQADILFSAVGKPGLITAAMVKKGAVVIDIGITPTPAGLKGDVAFASVSKKASAITPVPGGIGPMTVASLMRNCVVAKARQVESAKI